MTERERIQNNERAKAWFQTHKNDPKLKVRRKKYDEKYYLKNKEKIAEKQKKYRQTHKNDPKLKVRRKKYDEKYYLKNKEKIAEKKRQYYEKNKDKINSQKRTRRKLLKQLKENK